MIGEGCVRQTGGEMENTALITRRQHILQLHRAQTLNRTVQLFLAVVAPQLEKDANFAEIIPRGQQRHFLHLFVCLLVPRIGSRSSLLKEVQKNYLYQQKHKEFSGCSFHCSSTLLSLEW